jgi:hypothetical protein
MRQDHRVAVFAEPINLCQQIIARRDFGFDAHVGFLLIALDLM